MSSHERQHGDSHVHVSPVSTYIVIFAALLGLTGLTVWVAFQDLGRINDLVALGIATIKMTLVILWFMHVKYSSRLTKIIIVSAFLWLLILFSFTLSDYWTRDWLSP